MDSLLPDYPITHAGIRRIRHPDLGVETNSQTAVRYLRFMHPVLLSRLELARSVYGRWVPDVPTHPAHLILSTLDPISHRWNTVEEIDLPFDPKTAGAGLSQSMSMAQIEAHFKTVLNGPPFVIDLDGLVTDHLRVECDREYPVWPSHGECNGGPYNVPFGILDPLKAFGSPVDAAASGIPVRPYLPGLSVGKLEPAAPVGMEFRQTPFGLHYEGFRFSVCFSIHRPMLMHLGWDVLGAGEARNNRLLTRTGFGIPRHIGGLSGPLLRTINLDYGSQQWTGEVSAQGNRVEYRNLHCISGLTIDAIFTVESDRMLIELTQSSTSAMPAIETEAWRLAWDATAGSTGAVVVPDSLPGRSGRAHFPAIWAGDGNGCLSLRMLEGDPELEGLQIESYRNVNTNTGGVVVATATDLATSLMIPKGAHRSIYELAVTNFEPVLAAGAPEPGEGIRRHWATTYSCFRPEFRGFANNSVSTNAHVSQAAPMDLVAVTRPPEYGPSPVSLGRYTVETAFLGGGGYGYWRNLYLDTDPILVCAAGRLHQVEPDLTWLRRIEPGLRQAAERMLNNLGEKGLIVSKILSGNSGSFRWSSNIMDVVGFGHLDAYVNAISYRGFRNATALLSGLGQPELAKKCRKAAEGIKAGYMSAFLNPDTGWVAGWRSRDGKLHDYGFTYINGVAAAFGLLPDEIARQALMNLEQIRKNVGAGSATWGIPCNLLPFEAADHLLPQIMYSTQPTFETYTDGSLSGWPATYYLRALSIYRLKDNAQKMADELEKGYAAGYFNGGVGSGREFRSWEGLANGYEGTLIVCFSPLYAIAIEKGLVNPAEPEWWPAGG